jgi:hypothetical protein
MKAMTQIAASRNLRNVGMLGGGQRWRRSGLECPWEMLPRPSALVRQGFHASPVRVGLCASASSEDGQEVRKLKSCPDESRKCLSELKVKLRSIGELALRSCRALAYTQSVISQCDLDAGRRSQVHNCTANRIGGARHKGRASGQPCVCEMVIFKEEELNPDHADWQRLIRACLQLYVGKGKRIAYAATVGAHLRPFGWSHSRGLRCGLLYPSEVCPSARSSTFRT